MIKKLALAVISIGAMTSMAFAANNASDNASNSPYEPANVWANGSNGGSGFGAWVLSTGVTGSSFFMDTSATNAGGSSGTIDTAGKSWGIFSNNGTTAADAIRPLTGGSLLVGQSITLQLDNGFIQNGGAEGFGLQTSTGANRIEFFFNGGATGYTLLDNTGSTVTAIPFTGNGLSISFTLTGTDTYSLKVTPSGSSTSTFTGTLAGTAGTGIAQIRAFDFNGGIDGNSNLYINSLAVIPEPSTLSLLAGPAVLGALFFIRRRRA